ncbi:MAG: hypothetical protein AAF658_15950, partial [Myxococcota bacterium]
ESFARSGHQLTAAGSRGEAFVTGGLLTVTFLDAAPPRCGPSNSALCEDVLVLDDDGIDRAPLVRAYREGNMPGRVGHSATYTARDGGVFVFGGDDFIKESWLLDLGADDRPRHLYSVSFSEADVPNAVVQAVEARAIAGGDAGSGSGATLRVWDYLRWRDTGVSHAAPAEAPAELSWDSRSDPDFQALPLGAARSLYFAVEPDSPAGEVGATIVTDYVEARVCYRHP